VRKGGAIFPTSFPSLSLAVYEDSARKLASHPAALHETPRVFRATRNRRLGLLARHSAKQQVADNALSSGN